eukprot:355929-Chlamydomonas_euryale.AAC.2
MRPLPWTLPPCLGLAHERLLSEAWRVHTVHTCPRSYHLLQLNLTELANLVWACAKWEFRPSAAWMALFYRQCE